MYRSSAVTERHKKVEKGYGTFYGLSPFGFVYNMVTRWSFTVKQKIMCGWRGLYASLAIIQRCLPLRCIKKSRRSGMSTSWMRCSSAKKWGIYSHFAFGSVFLLEKNSKSEGVIIDFESSAMFNTGGMYSWWYVQPRNPLVTHCTLYPLLVPYRVE